MREGHLFVTLIDDPLIIAHTRWHCRRRLFGRIATASNETAMAADDAQPAVEVRNGGAPARPPQPLVFGPNKAESWNIFRRRWSHYCTLSDIATKPRNYQVAMLETSLGDEAMRLYDGFQFEAPQEHRTTTEILSTFDEFAIEEANETCERYKFNSRKQEDGESFEDFHADQICCPIHWRYHNVEQKR